MLKGLLEEAEGEGEGEEGEVVEEEGKRKSREKGRKRRVRKKRGTYLKEYNGNKYVPDIFKCKWLKCFIKIHRVSQWIIKQDSYIRCL